jgi:hypothetical protein
MRTREKNEGILVNYDWYEKEHTSTAPLNYIIPYFPERKNIYIKVLIPVLNMP